MQIYPDKLVSRLEKQLDAVYLLAGDEPLVMQESADAVRAAARSNGYAARDVFSADRGFDWNSLRESSRNLSLFSERRIIEVRIPTGKPGDAGAKALRALVEDLPEDTLLIVLCGKMDASMRRTKWVEVLSKAGVFVPIWPVNAKQLPGWICSRMEQKGIYPSQEAVALLAERVEGNLLACAQEIEKLSLLFGAGKLDARVIADSVGDSARFGVYGLIDSALEGVAPRCERMLQGLKEEGVDAVAILGALTWELRKLAMMSQSVNAGTAIGQVLTSNRVWDSRKAIVGRALERHTVRAWLSFLLRSARLDRMAKGQADGNVWDELLQLLLAIAGIRLLINRKVRAKAA